MVGMMLKCSNVEIIASATKALKGLNAFSVYHRIPRTLSLGILTCVAGRIDGRSRPQGLGINDRPFMGRRLIYHSEAMIGLGPVQ